MKLIENENIKIPGGYGLNYSLLYGLPSVKHINVYMKIWHLTYEYFLLKQDKRIGICHVFASLLAGGHPNGT